MSLDGPFLPGRLSTEKDYKDTYKKDHLLRHIFPSPLLPTTFAAIVTQVLPYLSIIRPHQPSALIDTAPSPALKSFNTHFIEPRPSLLVLPLSNPTNPTQYPSKAEKTSPCRKPLPPSYNLSNLANDLPFPCSWSQDPDRHYSYRLTATRLSHEYDSGNYSAMDQWYRRPETHEQLAVQGATSCTYRSESERKRERRRAEERWGR